MFEVGGREGGGGSFPPRRSFRLLRCGAIFPLAPLDISIFIYRAFCRSLSFFVATLPISTVVSEESEYCSQGDNWELNERFRYRCG